MPKKKPKKRPKTRKNREKRFLDVSFGIGRDAHPEIYDFFLGHATQILRQLQQQSCELVLERLEPLNSAYSHLDVSSKIMNLIFKRFCRSHKLRPFAAFSPKEKISCRGKIKTEKISEVLQDYNLLFDIFFCDIRIRSPKIFVDSMDLFSNRILVESDTLLLKNFQKMTKKALPKTRFRML